MDAGQVSSIAALLVLSFALLASEVIEGDTRAFDERILLFFRNAWRSFPRSVGPPGSRRRWRDITALGGNQHSCHHRLSAVAGFLAGIWITSRGHHGARIRTERCVLAE